MKRLISILVSLALLALIYSQIDVQALGRVLRTCNPFWLIVGLVHSSKSIFLDKIYY